MPPDHPLGLAIGPLKLRTNLLLAPIAGYCDLAFRMVCREWGGVGLACTDLLSPQGLLRGTATSLDLAKTSAEDKPVGMQLYGSDPEIMAEGARWAVEHGATVVDINMGCPVDKVTKKDGGSKLLTDLSKAVGIAARVVRELEKVPVAREEWGRRAGGATERRSDGATEGKTRGGGCKEGGHDEHCEHGEGSGCEASCPSSLRRSVAPSLPQVIPLTCKMRLCWHTSDYEAGAACSPHLARMLADVGVAAVTVHGRTTEDKFQGTVRLDGISRVVESVGGRIPVIGNGDVREPEDAARMILETGCDGVMIGRGALSTPWIFRDTWSYLCTGERPAAPTEPEIVENLRRFFDLMREQRDDRYALFQINRRVSWFAKRLGHVHPATGEPARLSVKPFKEAVRTARTAGEVYDAFDAFKAGRLRGGRMVEAAGEGD